LSANWLSANRFVAETSSYREVDGEEKDSLQVQSVVAYLTRL